jgi:hypothetical protein
MKDYQVVMFSDMPDPGETYYGVGLCASSRAYKAIYKLSVIENYLTEKVAGLRPLAIYIVNGVLDSQLKSSIAAARQEEVSRGLVGYMGAVIIGIPDEMQPQVATIPLAELPDRFSRKEEFDISILTYADALGLDPQDLQPLGGQALGTGAQSIVLNDKAKGKGMNAWKQDFTHALNEFIMPEETVFTFTEKDYRDISQRANVENVLATAATARIGAKITTPAQELQLMVDQDVLPKEFLPRDITPGDNLSDTEKPISAAPSAFDPEQPLAEQAQGRLNEDGRIVPGAKTDAQLQNEEVARMIASGQGDQVGYGGGDKRSPDEVHAAEVEKKKKDEGKPPKTKPTTKELIEAVSEPAALYAKEILARQLPALDEITEKGGAGSGNFNHAGRPGERGGSAPANKRVSDSTRVATDKPKLRPAKPVIPLIKPGTVPYKLEDKTPDEFTKHIAHSDYEQFGMYDASGKLAYFKTGDEDDIQFSYAELKKLKKLGGVCIHNHPGFLRNGYTTGFSAQDHDFFFSIGCSEGVAIAGNTKFVIKPKPGKRFPKSSASVRKTLADIEINVYAKNMAKLHMGEMEVNEANKLHSREVAQEVANAFDLIYEERSA